MFDVADYDFGPEDVDAVDDAEIVRFGTSRWKTYPTGSRPSLTTVVTSFHLIRVFELLKEMVGPCG